MQYLCRHYLYKHFPSIMAISCDYIEKSHILWYNALLEGFGPAKSAVRKGFYAVFVLSKGSFIGWSLVP